MTPAERLQEGRDLAEDARPLRLKYLAGDLLVLARVAPGQLDVARGVVVTAPEGQADLGLVSVRFSHVKDALAMAMTGWVLGRVAHGSRMVGPLPEDDALARRRLNALGLDPTRPLYDAVTA